MPRLPATWPLLVAAALVAAGACAPRPLARPAALPGPRVPPGCEQRQEGSFAHETRREWEYQARDDGETLLLRVGRQAAEGATAEAPVRIILQRTPEGFVGHAESVAFPGGAGCPVTFPTRVVACEEHALTLATVAEVSVDDGSCEVALPPEPMPWTEHRLVRLPPAEAAPDEP
jgi:hypothetical protein